MSVFLFILNMSISSILIIMIALAGRFALNKSPKLFTCILWILVFIKLICPYTYRIPLNIYDTNKIDINYTKNGTVSYFGLNSDEILNKAENNSTATSFEYLNNQKGIVIAIFTLVWIAGIVLLLLFNLLNYINLKKRIRNAVLFKDNIYISKNISASFVLGIFKPKIYIPDNLNSETFDFVVMHEKKHIENHDNYIKFVIFLITVFHWFNPLVWISFKLFSLDLEIMCDGKVAKNFTLEDKKKYCYALLACSTKKEGDKLYTTGFSQNSTKTRITYLMKNNKKSKLVISYLIVFVCAILFYTGMFGTKASLFPIEVYDINVPYKYIASDELSEIILFEDKMKACQIPDDLIDRMSTEALIESCINHPLFLTVLVSGENLYQSSFDNFKDYCSAIQKLLQRKDLADSLFKVYSQTAIITDYNYREDMNYNEFFRTSFLELLLAQPEVRQNASDKTMSLIEQEVAYKYNLQLQANINSKIGIYYAVLEFNIN